MKSQVGASRVMGKGNECCITAGVCVDSSAMLLMNVPFRSVYKSSCVIAKPVPHAPSLDCILSLF